MQANNKKSIILKAENTIYLLYTVPEKNDCCRINN